jgi:hypothetical protein
MKTRTISKSKFAVEKLCEGEFQAVYPSNLSELSAIYPSKKTAWEAIEADCAKLGIVLR